MRLSEAIRLGSMLGPQTYGNFSASRRKYFFGLLGPKVGATCALGAAYQAATGGRSRLEVVTEDRAAFRGVVKAGQTQTTMETPANWPMWTWVKCPECLETAMPIRRMIPHLNDTHKWSRERIAEFVDPYEPREAISSDGEPLGFSCCQGSDVEIEKLTR